MQRKFHSSCCCGCGGHGVKCAFSTVYMAAVVLNAIISFPRIMFPASQFNGDSASGSDSNANTARHAACKPHAGLHSFLSISKHISPVRKWTFGWNIFVINLNLGGLKGKSWEKVKFSLKTPPLYGVSSGPIIVAYQCNRSLEMGPAAMLGGESNCISWRCLIILCSTLILFNNLLYPY